jgi:pimeloyl-ACP methyl ester carboxylesterase
MCSIKTKKIFIHGLDQSPHSWDNVLKFTGKNDDVICLDLFKLIENKEFTYKNLYREFSNYLKNISEPMILCGLSLGGVLALNYAIDNSEKIDSLILIAAQYKMPKTLLKIQNVIMKILPKFLFKGSNISKENLLKLTNSMLNLDFSKSLDKIKCRTLIICGSKDTVNLNASKMLSENIENSQLKIFENQGHIINESAPKLLADSINEFMTM